MKKTLFIAAVAAMLIPSPMKAQDKVSDHFTPYGFLRTYGIFDSRENQAGSEDLFYYLPLDKDINMASGTPTFGKDLNANPSLKLYAITTRLGFNMAGYKVGNADVTGKVETDFYCMNGSTATLRLRQAYINFGWKALSGNKYDLKVGQAWHPMAADRE